LKDALVKQTATRLLQKQKEMKTALSAVKMETLAMDVHMVWMKEMSGLMTSAGAIAATQDIELQREIFIPFSKSI
jgi:hypothetical protein